MADCVAFFIFKTSHGVTVPGPTPFNLPPPPVKNGRHWAHFSQHSRLLETSGYKNAYTDVKRRCPTQSSAAAKRSDRNGRTDGCFLHKRHCFAKYRTPTEAVKTKRATVAFCRDTAMQCGNYTYHYIYECCRSVYFVPSHSGKHVNRPVFGLQFTIT